MYKEQVAGNDDNGIFFLVEKDVLDRTRYFTDLRAILEVIGKAN